MLERISSISTLSDEFNAGALSRGKTEQHVQATVDSLLLKQGDYAPVEILLALGHLSYARYEAWRCGEVPYLEDALAGNPECVVDQLEVAAAWAERLGLAVCREQYRGWGTHAGKTLHFARSPNTDRLFATHYRRAVESEPQLDLFLDGGATVAINDMANALAARDRALAEIRLRALLERCPEHRLRTAAEQLYDALANLENGPYSSDPVVETTFLEKRLTVLAGELLGHRARDFLVPFWRRIARTLDGRPYDPTQDHLHVSRAYAECLDWHAVYDSIRRTEGGGKQPRLLGRLAEACRHLDRRSEAIAHLCELCWRFPDHARERLDAAAFPDPVVQKFWEDFQDLDTEMGSSWFPAWLLLGEPGLAHALPKGVAPTTAAAGRVFRILQQLLAAGENLSYDEQVCWRKELRKEHPGFLALYLRGVAGKKDQVSHRTF